MKKFLLGAALSVALLSCMAVPAQAAVADHVVGITHMISVDKHAVEMPGNLVEVTKMNHEGFAVESNPKVSMVVSMAGGDTAKPMATADKIENLAHTRMNL